jgi:hypothetical protein
MRVAALPAGGRSHSLYTQEIVPMSPWESIDGTRNAPHPAGVFVLVRLSTASQTRPRRSLSIVWVLVVGNIPHSDRSRVYYRRSSHCGRPGQCGVGSPPIQVCIISCLQSLVLSYANCCPEPGLSVPQLFDGPNIALRNVQSLESSFGIWAAVIVVRSVRLADVHAEALQIYKLELADIFTLWLGIAIHVLLTPFLGPRRIGAPFLGPRRRIGVS